MKSLIIAIAISVFLFGGSIICTSRLDKLSHLLINENEKSINYLNDKNFEKALDHMQIISESIDEKKNLLAMALDHTELDRIEGALSEMKAYAENDDKTNALAKASALNIYLEHLPKNYKLKLENIL